MPDRDETQHELLGFPPLMEQPLGDDAAIAGPSEETNQDGFAMQPPYSDVPTSLPEPPHVPPADLLQPEPAASNRRRAPLFIAAGLAGSLLVGGGVFVGMSLNREPVAEPTTEPSEEPTATTATAKATPTQTPSPEPTKTAESLKQDKGNLDLTYIAPGENFITATRPNGEVIKLPPLRDPEKASPAEVVSSILANVAGFMSTGDQEVLAHITQVDQVRHKLIDWREAHVSSSSDKGIQIIFFDTPHNRATFFIESVGIFTKISLKNPGSIKYLRHSAHDPSLNNWQNPYARNIIIDNPSEGDIMDYLGRLSFTIDYRQGQFYLIDIDALVKKGDPSY